MLRFLTPLALAALAFVATDASAQARLQSPSPGAPAKPLDDFGAIVGDGGFETGSPNAAWTDFSSNFGTVLCNAGCGTGGGTGPHAGAWWVWFGGTASAESGFVQQDVTIPAGSATLSYWLEIPSAANTGTLTVSLDGTAIATYTEADQVTYDTYVHVSHSINTFADGGVHTLRFEQSNPAGAGVINFFIDDVEITSIPDGPSLSVSPVAINFGGVEIGATSAPMDVTLTNNGTSAVTIASITISGDPAFSIDITGTDLALDPAESTTFSATFAPTATGAATATVEIASNAPGSPATVDLSGAGTNFTTYPSTDTPIAITDNDPAGVTSTITVPPGAGSIGDLDVMFHATHTWSGDLIATLEHNGTSVTFFDRPGVPESTFGCSGNDPNIIADDEGTDGAIDTDCTSGSNPTLAYIDGGRYTPNNPLSAFDGMDAEGTWTLTVSDNGAGDTGEISAWALLITPEEADIATYPSTDTPIAITDNDPAGVTSTITVPASPNVIVDLDVMFHATHTWSGDLIATLEHNGTSVTFFDRPGVPESTFGCSGNDPNIIADDEGTDGAIDTDCTSGSNPTLAYIDGGRYTPNNPLSAFDGMDVEGTWTLTVSDNGGGDTGEITAWALLVTENLPVAGENGPEGAAVAALRTFPNPVLSTGTVELTVPTEQVVRVSLYDMLGREVLVLFDGAVTPTQRAVMGFPTSGLPAGSYVVRATGEQVNLTQRVTIAR